MENAWNTKWNNNLRPMYVKEILLEHTDETHFLSVSEIIEILESTYGIAATRRTIYDDIEMFIATGIDIECVNGKNNRHMYHILTRDYEIAELRVMMDALVSFRSLPPAKTSALIRKISRLAGPSYDYLIQNTDIDGRPRAENQQIFYIIDTVYKAIVSKKQIAFKYYEYLTASNKQLKNKGEEYQVSPYRLVCCNDYYYLLAYSEKHENIVAFRVDRICGIPKESSQDCIPEPEDFSVDKYVKDTFHMKTGDMTEVSLEFDRSVIDAMVDHFGQEMNIFFIDKTTCRAKVKVQVNNIFFAWIFGFEGKVRIRGPKELQEDYIRMVSKEMARL